MKKILIFLFFSIYITACQSTDSSQNNPTFPITDEPLPDVPLPYPTKPFLHRFEGSIGGQFPISMVLTNWGDGYLNGKYWYHKTQEAIELRGEMLDETTFELIEFIGEVDNGNFKGTIHSPEHLTGTWRSVDGVKQFDFELKTPPKTETDIWSGNWYLNEIWDGGLLLMGDFTGDSIDFALSIFRSGHTGLVEGRAKITGQTARFISHEYGDEACQLTFHHHTTYIELDQQGSNFDCGFGARAYAGGQYDNRYFLKKATLHFDEKDATFTTQAQHDNFKNLIGEKFYDLFAFNMQITEDVEKNKADLFEARVVEGFVMGMFASNEAVIMYNEVQQFWAATIDINEFDQFVVRYFTNDETKRQELPQTIEDWRENFLDYPVIFESKENG